MINKFNDRLPLITLFSTCILVLISISSLATNIQFWLPSDKQQEDYCGAIDHEYDWRLNEPNQTH